MYFQGLFSIIGPMSRKKYIRSIGFPLLAALIWGTAFVSQRISAGHMGAFTFNGARGLVAFVAMGLVSCAFRRREYRESAGASRRRLVLGGVCCGVLLTVASNLQQLAMSDTAAGKAGFLTSLYIVLVPVLSRFLRRRVPAALWGSVAAAAVGLYLLCVREGFSLAPSDLLLLLCALTFAGHILAVDYFVRDANPLAMSCIQFAVMAALSLGTAFVWERPTWEQLRPCLGQILYVGIFSSAVAYTLQMAAQKTANPVTLSLLLSLESVFSAVAGVLFLRETLSSRECLGCFVILCAVILAQLPDSLWRRLRPRPAGSATNK